MQVVIDIECNGLENPTEIWLVVFKDIDTGELHEFKNITSNPESLKAFLEFSRAISLLIGHNIIAYDIPVLCRLVPQAVPYYTALLEENKTYDTLILSHLVDYPRPRHSIESYGEEFGIDKGKFNKWTDVSLKDIHSVLFKELEIYCIRDVEITYKVYQKYYRYLKDTLHKDSIELEHKFQVICNELSTNGFKYNVRKSQELLKGITEELFTLDKEIEKAFPPKFKLIKEVHPKVTKHGTLSRADFRFVKDGDLSDYNGGPFCRIGLEDFNPSSHKQLVQVLADAGWMPTDRTATHIEIERDIRRNKYSPKRLDLTDQYVKLKKMEKYGWKINEQNLNTLPEAAPQAAKSLAKRILLESRRRSLVEQVNLVQDDGRIHGRFQGIGAWTHRMAHQKPNTANIPNEYDTEGNVKLLGKEMRQLWQAPKNRLLVGVDAEGIQLRIFAHYIDDKEFIQAIVNGKKSNGTDPHSFNKRILGDVCKTRAAAKRFIYALLLGAGISKLAQILATSEDEARRALARLMERYQGFTELKETIIPNDAKHGWFRGLDGRKVRIPGETPGERKHLCMSGYLQNGEAIVMKKATLKWYPRLNEIEGLRWLLVNLVHDEWQTEVNNNMEMAIKVAQIQSDALREVGEELNLRCPLAGSYYNEDHHDYTIGTNWYTTH